MSAEPIDFAAVKAEHEAWHRCGPDGLDVEGTTCLIYRLAVEAEISEIGRAKWSEIAARAVEVRAVAKCERDEARAEAERLASQVAAVSRVLGNDNRRADADSVTALGDHVPKIARLIADLWLATGAHPERVQPLADQPEREQR